MNVRNKSRPPNKSPPTNRPRSGELLSQSHPLYSLLPLVCNRTKCLSLASFFASLLSQPQSNCVHNSHPIIISVCSSEFFEIGKMVDTFIYQLLHLVYYILYIILLLLYIVNIFIFILPPIYFLRYELYTVIRQFQLGKKMVDKSVYHFTLFKKSIFVRDVSKPNGRQFYLPIPRCRLYLGHFTLLK